MKLTTAQLALLLGLTTRRVNQLAQDGIVVRAGHGEFDGPESIQNYISSVANRQKDTDATINKEHEEARLKQAQADHVELKNAKLRNELLPIGEVVRVWSEQITSVKSALLAVVSRVKQRISLSVEDAIVLDEEIRDAMTKLADGVEIYDSDADDVEEGDVDLSTTSEDPALDMDGKGNLVAGDSVGGEGAD